MTDHNYALREHLGADKLYVVINEKFSSKEGSRLLLPTRTGSMLDLRTKRTKNQDFVVSSDILETLVEPQLRAYLEEAGKEEAEIEEVAKMLFHNHHDYIRLCGKRASEYEGYATVNISENPSFKWLPLSIGKILTIVKDKKSLDELFK